MSRMLTPDIERRLLAAIAELGPPAETVTREARLEDLDIDSLDLAEFAQVVDDEFGVTMRPDDMTAIDTVGDAIDFVTARA
jgi:acyl carrier protein